MKTKQTSLQLVLGTQTTLLQEISKRLQCLKCIRTQCVFAELLESSKFLRFFEKMLFQFWFPRCVCPEVRASTSRFVILFVINKDFKMTYFNQNSIKTGIPHLSVLCFISTSQLLHFLYKLKVYQASLSAPFSQQYLLTSCLCITFWQFL